MTKTEIQFSTRMNAIPESFIREILKVAESPGMISFAGGLPNPNLFPVEKLAEAAERVIRTDGRSAFQYTSTEGYLPLRDFLAQRQSALEGVPISAEDVVILNGSQQGLDLVGKIFCDKGRPILLEEPSYLGAIQAFSVYEPAFESLPLSEEGIDVNAFRNAARKLRPPFFYCIPNFQNPTGFAYTMENRLALVESAHSHNVLLVEDNPYGDIRFSGPPNENLHAMLPEKTLHLGSFSKIVSPGLRIGWATGPKEIVKKMVIAKQAADLHTNHLAQRIVFQYLRENPLEDHIRTIQQFYRQQAKRMVELMHQHFPPSVKWSEPQGGMFIWLILPPHASAKALLARAMAENVLIVPGENFFLTPGLGQSTARLNFSHPSGDEMERGLAILGKILWEMHSS